jgi:hypothetical protein
LERILDPSFELIRELLLKGRNRTDYTKEVIEDLGYTLMLWNAQDDDDAAHVLIRCGGYPAYHTWPGAADDDWFPPFSNECQFDLPYGGPSADRLFRVEALRELIDICVTVWDPDWGMVTTHETNWAIYGKGRQYGGPWAGWLTYLSDRYGRLPALPEG